MAVRVVFLGNSGSAFSAQHFNALLEVPCELVAVVDVPAAKQNTTNPLVAGLANFAAEADKKGIPFYQPSDPNTPTFTSELIKLKPDLYLAVGYPIILKKEILSVPDLLAVNFHASLLPDYRGKHPVFWALRNGEKWSGLTVHVMDRGIDSGDIIYQIKIRTRQDDTVAALYRRIMDKSRNLVGKLIADADQGCIPRQPQPKNTGSYYSSTTEQDFQIDWSWSADKIKRFISITPGKCFAVVGGQKVYFFNAHKEAGFTTSSPGTIQSIRRTRAAVSVGSGFISSSLIKIGNGQPESFAAFCRAHGFVPGDVLYQ